MWLLCTRGSKGFWIWIRRPLNLNTRRNVSKPWWYYHSFINDISIGTMPVPLWHITVCLFRVEIYPGLNASSVPRPFHSPNLRHSFLQDDGSAGIEDAPVDGCHLGHDDDHRSVLSGGLRWTWMGVHSPGPRSLVLWTLAEVWPMECSKHV